MENDLVSVIELARKSGKRKQSIFKVIKRLGIETKKLPGMDSRGQAVAYLSNEDAALIEKQLDSIKEAPCSPDIPGCSEKGVFYFILLEPDIDPLRFKVGYATNLNERVRHLRCSAPMLKVERTWPCKQLWEKTAIDCVTVGCERLHTEVFRTTAIDTVIARCEHFFGLMPTLAE
ncbi:MAG TPA: hypothetical protein PLA03_10175 [Acidobacteriota bacterium]|nr:hypothetical protein [Acidobacteriota bacterium]